MEVQVSHDIAVVVQHAGPERGVDACVALFALSGAGGPSCERQVCSHFTPEDNTRSASTSTKR